jgi:adenylate cyclase
MASVTTLSLPGEVPAWVSLLRGKAGLAIRNSDRIDRERLSGKRGRLSVLPRYTMRPSMIEGSFDPLGVDQPPGSRRIKRRLAAVLAADIKSYSLLIARDEEDAHRRVGMVMRRLLRQIETFSGRIFSFAGDGLMAEFPSAVDAVKCALRVQVEARQRNARQDAEKHIEFRIGINSGDIVVQGEHTGGNAVNIAARLEQIADPGGILISAIVFEQVYQIVPARYQLVGDVSLKNIAQPVKVYSIEVGGKRPSHHPMPAAATVTLRAPKVEYCPSLAVLPFRTLMKDESDAYLAAGMVDDIIRVLGGLKDLIVVSRSSTLGYQQSAPDLRRIGHELNVQYVLHGSVRRTGQAIRISVELSDARTRQTIWADQFEGNILNIFELQDGIALRTVSAIAPSVRDRELRRALLKDERAITAYDLMLRALDKFYDQDRRALTEAEDLLNRAAALDPTYATPLSHLAYVHLLSITRGWADNDHTKRVAAAEAAWKALERDGNDFLGLAIAGHLKGYLAKDHETALGMLDRAVMLAPSCALAWTFGSLTCGILGDTGAALERAQKAVRLAPIGPEAGPWHEHALSQAFYLAGNYEKAIAWGRAAANHGGQASNLRCLAASLVAAGQLDEARAVAHRIIHANPSFKLQEFRAYTPLKGRVADLFVERLRLAGLPN